ALAHADARRKGGDERRSEAVDFAPQKSDEIAGGRSSVHLQCGQATGVERIVGRARTGEVDGHVRLAATPGIANRGAERRRGKAARATRAGEAMRDLEPPLGRERAVADAAEREHEGRTLEAARLLHFERGAGERGGDAVARRIDDGSTLDRL